MRWPWQKKVEERSGTFGTQDTIERWATSSISASGVSVTEDTAVGIATIAEAIRQPATLIAGLPLDVYDVSQDRKTRTLSRGKWQNRLLDQPDPNRSGFDFWSDLSSHVDGYGNAYALKIRDGARVTALLLLDPDHMGIEVDSRTQARTYCYHREDGVKIEIPGGNIIHVRGWDPCGEPQAMSPVDRHRNAIGKIQARSQFEERFLRNDARPGVVIKMPTMITREQAQEFLDLWNAHYGGSGNVGKTAVLGGGADISTLPISLRDSQFVEAEQFNVSEIARIYNWPPELLGENSSRPFVEEMAKVVRLYLMPRIQRIEAAFGDDPDLFGATSKFRPFFDVSELLRGDAATMASVFHQLVQVGVMTPNEARIPLGLSPVDGGDELQATPVGGAPNSPGGAPPDPSTQQEGRMLDAMWRVAEAALVPQPDRDERLMRQAMTMAEAAQERALDVIKQSTQPDVIVNVPAPIVNVSSPEVTVQPAEVTVNVEPTPVTVNVPPAQLTLLPPEEKDGPEVKDVTIIRDPVTGLIAGARVVEQ